MGPQRAREDQQLGHRPAGVDATDRLRRRWWRRKQFNNQLTFGHGGAIQSDANCSVYFDDHAANYFNDHAANHFADYTFNSGTGTSTSTSTSTVGVNATGTGTDTSSAAN
ncbi:MAG: hypothetical protein HEQ39_18505 [Rhizobacter sp.]